MTTRDLGVIDAPVLVFGGPYGNLEATEALIAAAACHGIPAARAICTGDIVAYGADPQAVVDRLRGWGAPTVMGNCEESIAANAADCGCGFGENSTCGVLSVQWFAATRRDLTPAAARWMGTLPRRIVFTLAGRRFAVIHGGAQQINRFVFASTREWVKRDEIAALNVDAVIGGHCGLPFSQLIDGHLWHNAGAIGQPANDGTARVWYSTLMPLSDGILVRHHALTYDHGAAAAKMRARDYPLAYADSLASGLWPSCDILPPVEVAARGKALSPQDLLWRRVRLPAAAD